ncbi:MAG: hypothetical protein KC516_03330 [Nanoarchaeota archaeon]|nr:hypothetical protein [Nanoarchaeota archaeon]
MAKKKSVKKKTVKKKTVRKVSKKTAKKTTKKSSKKPSKKGFSTSSIMNKEGQILNRLWRVAVIFVLFLALYFVTSNYFLEVLFAIIFIISGALILAFLIILFAFWIATKRRKK